MTSKSSTSKTGWDHLYAVDAEALRQVRERKPWAEGQGATK
jgi:hypothetical protein